MAFAGGLQQPPISSLNGRNLVGYGAPLPAQRPAPGPSISAPAQQRVILRSGQTMMMPPFVSTGRVQPSVSPAAVPQNPGGMVVAGAAPPIVSLRSRVLTPVAPGYPQVISAPHVVQPEVHARPSAAAARQAFEASGLHFVPPNSMMSMAETVYNDGKALMRDEFASFCARVGGPPVQEKQCNLLFSFFDINGDNLVDFMEFVCGMMSIYSNILEGIVRMDYYETFDFLAFLHGFYKAFPKQQVNSVKSVKTTLRLMSAIADLMNAADGLGADVIKPAEPAPTDPGGYGGGLPPPPLPAMSNTIPCVPPPMPSMTYITEAPEVGAPPMPSMTYITEAPEVGNPPMPPMTYSEVEEPELPLPELPSPTRSEAQFSVFAPPLIRPDTRFDLSVVAFLEEYRAAVIAEEKGHGNAEMGALNEALPIREHDEVRVSLQLPSYFTVDCSGPSFVQHPSEQDLPTKAFRWTGMGKDTLLFQVHCSADVPWQTYKCTALISVNGEATACLQFDLTVGDDGTPSLAVQQQTKLHKTKRIIVMSTPEMGSANREGTRPYNFKVMEALSDLQHLRADGSVNFTLGFDRKGSTTAHVSDELLGEWWRDEVTIKKTHWFYGYCTRVKACAYVECQQFDGVLEVICLRGGPITQVEQKEMPRIIRNARHDAELSGVRCAIDIKYTDFHGFRDYIVDGVPLKPLR